MGSRWDGDDRGRGVGDAARLVPGADDLVAAFGHLSWVTEQPELHLLPHVEAWCRQDQRFTVTGAYLDGAAAYVLDLEWGGASGSIGEVRAATFALIGCFAESVTYVRQRWLPSDEGGAAMSLQFEVGTGELAPDARFEPHGHVVLINIATLPPTTHSE